MTYIENHCRDCGNIEFTPTIAEMEWLIKVAEAAKALRDAEDDYMIKNCQSEYSLNKMEKMATKLDRLLGEE